MLQSILQGILLSSLLQCTPIAGKHVEITRELRVMHDICRNFWRIIKESKKKASEKKKKE